MNEIKITVVGPKNGAQSQVAQQLLGVIRGLGFRAFLNDGAAVSGYQQPLNKLALDYTVSIETLNADPNPTVTPTAKLFDAARQMLGTVMVSPTPTTAAEQGSPLTQAEVEQAQVVVQKLEAGEYEPSPSEAPSTEPTEQS